MIIRGLEENSTHQYNSAVKNNYLVITCKGNLDKKELNMLMPKVSRIPNIRIFSILFYTEYKTSVDAKFSLDLRTTAFEVQISKQYIVIGKINK